MERFIYIGAIILIAAMSSGLVKSEPSDRTYVRPGQAPPAGQEQRYQRSIEKEHSRFQRDRQDFTRCINEARMYGSDGNGNAARCFSDYGRN